MKYIRSENLLDYAFINEDTLVHPLRGICVSFHGYTDATMYKSSDEIASALGRQGIAFVFPYYSVWAWMSRSSQAFNEQVIDAVYERLQADEAVPLIVSGVKPPDAWTFKISAPSHISEHKPPATVFGMS